MYPTRKVKNDAPVRVASKTLPHAGARTITATTSAQTRTVVMMIAGRSGVDLYAGAFSSRCSPAEPSEDMLVSPCYLATYETVAASARTRRGRTPRITRRPARLPKHERQRVGGRVH